MKVTPKIMYIRDCIIFQIVQPLVQPSILHDHPHYLILKHETIISTLIIIHFPIYLINKLLQDYLMSRMQRVCFK